MPISCLVRRLRRVAARLAQDATAATAIEYALIALLVAAVIAGALPAIPIKINATFTILSARL